MRSEREISHSFTCRGAVQAPPAPWEAAVCSGAAVAPPPSQTIQDPPPQGRRRGYGGEAVMDMLIRLPNPRDRCH